jgi:hypothetical protein
MHGTQTIGRLTVVTSPMLGSGPKGGFSSLQRADWISGRHIPNIKDEIDTVRRGLCFLYNRVNSEMKFSQVERG